MSVENIRVPPDSTGKRVHVQHNIELVYSSGTIDFKVGDVVVGQSSGASGVVAQVEGTTSAGDLYLAHVDSTPETFTVSENLQVATVTYAVADSQTDFYTQYTVNVGQNNPFNGQYVDNQGAAYMRFAEGAPQFDAFGKMQVSNATVLGEYINTYERDDKNWWYEEIEGGSPVTGNVSVEHIPSNQGTLFKVGSVSGDKAAATTHLYHKYQLGTSQLIEFTMICGDVGKTNLRRMWGYGDAQDGLFFRLEGTAFQVYMRSSTVGDHIIEQADFNFDRLDGTGLAGITLDVTKDNIYWIDFQWLGAGRVRFGVIIDGVRIVVHEMYHANKYAQPYIRTGSLPVHYEMSNLDTTISGSEMKVWCSVVKTEGSWEPDVREHFHHIRANEKVDGGLYKKRIFNWHPGRSLFSVRSKLTVNGLTNRTVAIPTHIAFSNEGNSPLYIQARRGAQLLGTPSWQDFHVESSLEYNDRGVEIDMDNRGVQTGMWVIPPNSTENVSLEKVFGYRKERILLNADGITQDTFTYTFTAWNMNPILGGADAGTLTCNFGTSGSPAIATITKTVGFDFDTEGFVTGQGLYVRNSLNNQNDGYYIIVNVTSDTLTVTKFDGTAASFVAETGTAGVTLQAGDTTKAFGSLNMEEIW